MAPCRSRLPALGFCEITRPFLTVREVTRLTAPTVQACDLIERFALLSVFRSIFGTTQGFGVGRRANVAVTVTSALVVTLQPPVPLQAPDQPTKTDPAAGLAVRATFVAEAKPCEQVVPQLIPVGELVTVPEPAPTFETVSVWMLGLLTVVVNEWTAP